MSDEQIIDLIKEGQHTKALAKLYLNYPAFQNAFKKAGGTVVDSEDVFQDALLIFIEKVSNEGFTLTCSINTFLYSICKNLALVYFREKKKSASIVQIEIDDCDLFDIGSAEQFIEREKKYAALDKVLMKIGGKCVELLGLFYVKGLKMMSIADRMGFSSEKSAKTQKYKCIEKARKLSESALRELQIQPS